MFTGDFTHQKPIPDEAIEAAVEVMRSGRLHRYNVVGEVPSEVELLEQEYAAWQGQDYVLALASGGQAMQIAMRAAGVSAGDKVLTNGFTLAPVPGAIVAVGGEPVLVEVTDELVIDLYDLDRKAATGAKYLLLSHMRGHLVDMDALMVITDRHGIKVIEDCAHTMGASWNGVKSGNFGVAACFSTQTYKHINSGEGGFLTTNDPQVMASAIMMSGSYMLYGRHGTSPAPEYFAKTRLEAPNMSARMDNLRAAILRPQLRTIDTDIAAWNERYHAVNQLIASSNRIKTLARTGPQVFVGSSIQFTVPNLNAVNATALLANLKSRGVELKWFGSDEPTGFTSNHHSWQYMPPQNMPQTDANMSALFDMRLPLRFSLDDCILIGEIIVEEVAKL